ncbi:MAG: hypothetical protein ACTS41_01425 [Candidatus Hodgkinia cicadicola]
MNGPKEVSERSWTTFVNAITSLLERVRIYNPPKWLHISKDYPLFEMAERRTLNVPSPYIVRLNMFHRPAKLGHKLSIASNIEG